MTAEPNGVAGVTCTIDLSQTYFAVKVSAQ